MGCHFFLQGIFPTQGSNPGLPHCRQTLYRLSRVDLPDPGIKPTSPALRADALPSESGRSLGEGNGNPLQYSCLENSMDGGAWRATAHGVAKSQTWLSDFTFTSLSMKLRVPYDSIYISGYMPKGNENRILTRYMHSHVYWGVVHNSQDTATTQVFINKLKMWCIEKVKSYVTKRKEEGYPFIFDMVGLCTLY